MSLQNKCGCEHCQYCKQREINNDETGHKCISFAYTVRIIKNILECEESLSSTQREAMLLTIDTIEELEKSLD